MLVLLEERVDRRGGGGGGARFPLVDVCVADSESERLFEVNDAAFERMFRLEDDADEENDEAWVRGLRKESLKEEEEPPFIVGFIRP